MGGEFRLQAYLTAFHLVVAFFFASIMATSLVAAREHLLAALDEVKQRPRIRRRYGRLQN